MTRWPWSRGNRHAWTKFRRVRGLLFHECAHCGELGAYWADGRFNRTFGCTALPTPASAPEREAGSWPRVSGE